MEGIATAGLALSVFTLFFLANKRNKTHADLLLAGLLITFSMPLMAGFLSHIHPPSRQFIPYVFGPYWGLLTGPLLYFYARDLSQENFRFKPKHLLHLLPFLLFLIYFLIMPPGRGPHNLPGPGGGPPGPGPGGHPPNDIIGGVLPFGILHLLSLLVYVGLTVLQLKGHRKRLGDYFSYTQQAITLNWLFWSSIILLVCFVAVGGTEFLTNEGRGPNFLLLNLGNMTLIFVFGYYGIRQTLIYVAPHHDTHGTISNAPTSDSTSLPHADRAELFDAGDDEQSEKEKYEKSGVKREEMDELLHRINSYVEAEKPYVNPRLTIEELAAMLDMSKHHISQVINDSLGVNFFNYINEYRIEEFKSRLMDPSYAHLTILAIALDSGFNSKSGFNAIFKRMTGQTPGEYKKEQESQQRN